MVRFKVIKGSHLLLGISIVILLAVVLFISIQSLSQQEVSMQTSISGARVVETLASSVSREMQIEIIPDTTTPPTLSKRILIYHTHTHEAYEQSPSDPYEAIETWRTDDQSHNVVRVGAVLAEELRLRGFEVIHDISDHELDDLNNSYIRSLETLETYTEPFDLYIDLHRDAFVDGMLPCFEDGEQYAQLMLLVGRGDNHDPALRPDYENNLSFAQRLTAAMNRIKDGICRNVTVKTGRYNQHVGSPSILIEFGHNRNTLQQALNSTAVVADAIDAVL